MAGSYYHIVDEESGEFCDNELFVDMIENLGDAYEMAEEMYGMIWWLANKSATTSSMTSEELVKRAHQEYTLGLALAKQNKNKPAL